MSTMKLASTVLVAILVAGVTGCGVQYGAGTNGDATIVISLSGTPTAGDGSSADGRTTVTGSSQTTGAQPETEADLPSPGATTARPGVTEQSQSNQDNRAERVIRIGQGCLGAKYTFGAPPSMAPKVFDCSSFTQYVYSKVGVRLPRTATQQAEKGQKVTGALTKADLVFFHISSRKQPIGHVGIAVGDGRVLHAISKGVTFSSLSGTWKKILLEERSRRVL